MAGLTAGMASDAPKNPRSMLTDKGRKDAQMAGTNDRSTRDQAGNIGEDKGIGLGRGRRGPGKCLPKTNEIPTLTIKSEGLAAHILYMKDHALIAKFIGIWPIERNLIRWINHHWKPKGGYELQLGAKGLFTVVFYNLEDKNKIFEGGPCFYNLAGLYLTF